MKKVIINNESYNVVETLEDVFIDNPGKKIEFVEEYEGFYYICFEPEHFYDEAMYKIEISTNKARCIHIIDYFLEVDGKGKRIDPQILKRAG